MRVEHRPEVPAKNSREPGNVRAMALVPAPSSPRVGISELRIAHPLDYATASEQEAQDVGTS
jgi:hypothetical protein